MQTTLRPRSSLTGALAAALGYLDFRYSGLNWRTKAPKLTAWYDDFRETPAMLATAPREG
ncbi:MAG: glutathione S-transferase C-terminal domain-containing protein [Pseudomonadota bacterium]